METCLQIMQHRIDLSAVQAPAAAVEYARRLAQRGTPLTTLLRTYRLGHARFSDWLLRELARHADDARLISATTLSMSRIVAAYIDQTSEEMVAAYTQEREHWLRNQNAARAARVRELLSGDRSDVRAAEATLGYRLRQYHVGLVCWVGDAVRHRRRAHQAGARRRPGRGAGGLRRRSRVPAPRRIERLGLAAAGDPRQIRLRRSQHGLASADIHFAFGDPAKGPGGFCLTYLQAMAAESVALAAGSRGTSGADVHRGRARGDDARIRGPAARLGTQHARGPGHRR